VEWIEWVEWIAAILSAVSVYLSTRENIWSWPTAIVSVAMYAFVFLRAGLYSDAGLQVFFFAISVYGWYEWLHGGENRTRLHVSRATPKVWAVAAVVGIAFWIVLGYLTSTLQGVSLPFLDSALTTLSIIAQIMMTRKILENWILWIIADIVYVPMYVFKGLYPTAGLYAVFLVLAIMGLVQWRRSYEREHPVAAPVLA
jgi:nicotinamide mononucleotide transporter